MKCAEGGDVLNGMFNARIYVHTHVHTRILLGRKEIPVGVLELFRIYV